MDPKALEKIIRRLLAEEWPDEQLRSKLEQLAEKENNFSGFTWLWGPELYRRNRVLFRPFILSRFGQLLVFPKHKWEVVRWKGDVADVLEPWLAEVDASDDIELFRRLYEWRLGALPGGVVRDKRHQAILADLVPRFRAATSRSAREIVLRKFSLWFELTEPGAITLYETDAMSAAPYILRHLPGAWLEKNRPFWLKLLALADARQDTVFRWQLYRRQVPREIWEKDILTLAGRLRDGAELDRALEQSHPEGWNRSLGEGFLKLLKLRGREVFPYITRHLQSVRHGIFSGGDYAALLALARERGWWDLWAATVRVCANTKEFNAEIAGLLNSSLIGADEVRRRLAALCGVSREFNWAGFGLAAIHQLDQANACALLNRFPELLRGPFLAHLQMGPWGGTYPKFIAELISRGEEDLLDHVAARLATRAANRWARNGDEMLAEAERLSGYYEGLKADEHVFSRRAAAVLGRIPAFAIRQYGALIRENRLARLLFERSAKAYLADPRSLTDLVEGAEIHVQALAYRALGEDDPRARELAGKNLPLLLGTLLRPLHRATRILAFRALANAAHTPKEAALVLAKAREALDLPDDRYPKEELLGLIASLLARWPDLRSAAEHPVIFRGAAA